MKASYAHNGMRLTGKAWQVRQILRAWLQFTDGHATLADHLKKRAPSLMEKTR